MLIIYSFIHSLTHSLTWSGLCMVPGTENKCLKKIHASHNVYSYLGEQGTGINRTAGEGQ